MRGPIPMVLGALVLTAALPGASPGQQAATAITSGQFRQLHWLHGTWLGSGGAYPAFYEEYRPVNDSTIRMRAFADSTFAVATDSSLIELRGGTISKTRGGRIQYVAILVQPDRIQFLPPGAARGGFTFTRRSRDEWTATLHPVAAGRTETVYTMRRLGP